MKKSRIPSLIAATILTSIFFSCIDNDDSYYIKCERDIGFITTKNNIKCAATSYGYITSPEIRLLTLNECYFFGYQISDAPVHDVYTASQIFNKPKEPIPQTLLQIGQPDDSNTVAIRDLHVLFSTSTNYLGDRWIFAYSAPIRGDEKVTAHFYYDKNHQTDQSGNNVKGKNKLIIDVYFTKTSSTESKEALQENYFTTTGNLESLRAFAFTPEYSKEVTTEPNGSMYMAVKIVFRYHQYITANQSAVTYVGSWNKDVNQNVYSIIEYYYTNNTRE
jgi:hypothetical protein